MCVHTPGWYRLARWLPALAPFLLSAAPTPDPNPAPDPADNLAGLPLDQLLEIRVESVDAASKRNQLVSEAPSSVTIVDRDQIRKLGYTSLADILRQVRGFYVSNDRNYSYLGARGFSPPGDYNSRVLFLINGQRIADGVTEGTLIGNEFPVDVDLIERVEVVRGPGSAIYGSSALFGVVNVVTRAGAAYGYGQASAEVGSYDTYKGRFTLGHKWDNEVDLLVSGTWLDRGGHPSLYFPEFDHPPESDGVAHWLDREEAQSAYARLAWKGLTLEGGHVDRFKRIPTASFDTVFGAAGTQTDDRKDYLRAGLDRTLENGIQVVANLSYNLSAYDGTYIYEQDLPGGGTGTYPLRDGFRSEWVGGDVLVRRSFLETVTLTAGLEVRDNLHQDQFSAEDRAPYVRQLDDHRHSMQLGPYAEAEWRLHPRLTLSAGLRYDYYEGRANSWNPRLAAVYRPWDSTHLKLLYGTAFRAPNAYELYYGDGDQTQKPSSGLRPEQIRTYEAVWEQDLGPHYKTTLAAFLYEATDLITLTTDPADDLLVYQNTSRTRAIGLEAELEGRWESGLRGRISYAYQQSHDLDTRQPLSNSPRHMVQGSLIVPLYREHLFAGIDGRHLSGRITPRGGLAGGYFEADVTLLAYRWAKGAELSASIYNVFDRRFADPVGTDLRQDSIVQDGRAFRVKLSYSF